MRARGLNEPLLLVALAHERPHHARTAQALAHHLGNAVELGLHGFKQRHALGHHQGKHRSNKRQAHRKDQAHAPVDGDGGDKRAHSQKRPADKLADRQGHGQLHLVDVVDDAGGQRRGAKAVELGKRQPVHAAVQLAAHVGPHTLGGYRGALLADEHDEDAGHGHAREHQPAAHHDIGPAARDALVDHARHHKGREQIENDLDQLGGRSYDEPPGIRATESFEQVEHARPLRAESRLQHVPSTVPHRAARGWVG